MAYNQNKDKVVQVRNDSTTEDSTSSKGCKDFRMHTSNQRMRVNVYLPNMRKRLKGDNSNSTLKIAANTLIILSIFFSSYIKYITTMYMNMPYEESFLPFLPA